MKYLILLLCLGCSTFTKKTPEDPSDLTRGAELREVYDARLAIANKWKSGIPSPTDCDGALWAGVAAAGGVRVDLSLFVYPLPGQTQRRPETPCWPNDLDGNGKPDSKSTTSNDMLIGLGYGLFKQGDMAMLQAMHRYAEENSGFIGQPKSEVGRVVLKLNPGIMLRRSAGEGGDALSTAYAQVKEDYQYHIQVLNILWETEQAGFARSNGVDRIKDAVKAYPQDYLFAVAHAIFEGGMDEAAKLLLKGIAPSSYVRGKHRENLALANWLLAARLALDYSNPVVRNEP